MHGCESPLLTSRHELPSTCMDLPRTPSHNITSRPFIHLHVTFSFLPDQLIMHTRTRAHTHTRTHTHTHTHTCAHTHVHTHTHTHTHAHTHTHTHTPYVRLRVHGDIGGSDELKPGRAQLLGGQDGRGSSPGRVERSLCRSWRENGGVGRSHGRP